MKRLSFFIFIILFCGSCVNVNYFHYNKQPAKALTTIYYYPVHVDVNFAEDDKRAIQSAIDQWNIVFNNAIKIEVVDWSFDMSPEILKNQEKDHSLILMKVDHTSKLIYDDTKNKHITLAWVNKLGGDKLYVVRDRISGSDMLERLMLHEFGHVFKCMHQAKSLMNPLYDEHLFSCIDKETATHAAEALGINAKLINYCVLDN